jgi:septum formation inhibitor MinC
MTHTISDMKSANEQFRKDTTNRLDKLVFGVSRVDRKIPEERESGSTDIRSVDSEKRIAELVWQAKPSFDLANVITLLVLVISILGTLITSLIYAHRKVSAYVGLQLEPWCNKFGVELTRLSSSLIQTKEHNGISKNRVAEARIAQEGASPKLESTPPIMEEVRSRLFDIQAQIKELNELESIRGSLKRLAESGYTSIDQLIQHVDRITNELRDKSSRIEALENSVKEAEDDYEQQLRDYEGLDKIRTVVLAEKESTDKLNVSLTDELKLANEKYETLTNENFRLTNERETQINTAKAECNILVNTIRSGYREYIPEEVLVLFGLSSESLAVPVSKSKFPVIRSYQNLLDTTVETFVAVFQDFDSSLAGLRNQPDFDDLRKRVESDIRTRFESFGYAITWNLRGRPFDPAYHKSESGVGSTVSGVNRALIKQGAEVVVKAYVTTI